MRMRIPASCLSLALCLLVVHFANQPANGQGSRRRPIRSYRNATQEPFVSPYLNLLRPGDPAFNYSTTVQPQLIQQQNSRMQQQEIRNLNRQVQYQQDVIETPYGQVGGLRPTSRKAATYGNYSHYYPARGQGASVGKPPRNYPSPVSTTGGMGMGGMGMGGGF
ncbi:MAG: hypothetical protein ACREHD_13140 [Pirellulales bacterium]